MQYSYDNLGQLIGVSGARQETYVYDANGNRLYAASPALPNGEAYYTIGPENRLLSDGTYRYEYDAEGNLIRKTRISDGQATEFTYDYRNRVTDIVVKDAQGNVVYRTHYIYDVFDRRIATEVDADGDGPQQPVRTWTFYDGDNPYIDLDDQGNVQQYYLYGPDIDQVLARLDPATGIPDWYLTDYIGSVRAIVRDAGGYVKSLELSFHVAADIDPPYAGGYGNGLEVLDEITYDSFGNVLSETNPAAGDRFKFAARELDAALSLYYYRARWYDPQAGRFLREDPLSFTAGDTNLYRYVFNSPLGFTDPSGQLAIIPVIVGIVVAGAAVAGGVCGYYNGDPGPIEGWIPGWGAGRNAGACFSRGEYGWATAYCCLAASDVALIRSLATAGCKVALKPNPGMMELIITEGKPFHTVWEIGDTACHAAGTKLGKLEVGRAFVHKTEGCILYPVGLGGLGRERIVWASGPWLPVLNGELATKGRVGCHAFTCVTAPISAWSCGNYHIPLYVLSHGGVGTTYCLSHLPQGAENDMIIPVFGPPIILPKQVPPVRVPESIFRLDIDPCPSRYSLLAR